jgi:segregation and condensation protein B
MNWKPVVEAIIYVTEEPVTAEQMAAVLAEVYGENPPSKDDIRKAISELIAEYQTDTRGIEIKEVAGGFKMATKPEHHETVRQFVRALKPPVKLSLAALETLAVIAYRQPATLPEIQEVRGVHAAAVIKTLLDKKLITTAGRKEVIGRPVLYRTTREFLVQFGLKDLSELPSLKEFEELSKAAMLDTEPAPAAETEPGDQAAQAEDGEDRAQDTVS